MMFFTLSLPLLINSVRQKFSATQNRHAVGKFEESHCTCMCKNMMESIFKKIGVLVVGSIGNVFFAGNCPRLDHTLLNLDPSSSLIISGLAALELAVKCVYFKGR